MEQIPRGGDRWLLARDPDTGRVFVRHEPNLPSGGQVADIEIGAFLIASGNGPEKLAQSARKLLCNHAGSWIGGCHFCYSRRRTPTALATIDELHTACSSVLC